MARSIGKGLFRLAVLLVLLAAGILLAGWAIRLYYQQAYPLSQYSGLIRQQAEENGLPVELVYAVCRTESGFRPQAVSSVGARGLMQITEETFDWIKSHKEPAGDTTFEEMFDPATNVAYGCFLLRMLHEEFGSTANALCAYHAGWGNAKKWLADSEITRDGQIENIPFGDTSAYVKKVLRTANIYRDLYRMNTKQGT